LAIAGQSLLESGQEVRDWVEVALKFPSRLASRKPRLLQQMRHGHAQAMIEGISKAAKQGRPDTRMPTQGGRDGDAEAVKGAAK